jgi:hypothetical protein
MEIFVFVCFRRWIEKTLIMGKKEGKDGAVWNYWAGKNNVLWRKQNKWTEWYSTSRMQARALSCYLFGIC